MTKNKGLLCIVLAVFMAFACKGPETSQKALDLSQIDSSYRPQDDFFRYANGNWLARTEIPSTESSWGSFNILQEKATSDLNSILLELGGDKEYTKGSLEQMVADLYRSGMDSSAIEESGYLPISEDLDRIADISKPEEILPEIALEISSGQIPLAYGQFPSHYISFYVYQDAKNSQKMAAQFDQGDLGLPSKEYYFKTDSTSVDTRVKYLRYIQTFFELTGVDEENAAEKAEHVLQLETKLADASKTPTELRDPIANYHKYTVAQADSIMPKLDWKTLITNLGIKTDTILIGQPEYYQAFEELLYSEGIESWKDMLAFWMIRNNSGALSSAFVENQFDFYGRTLYGQKELKPRWKRISRIVNAELRDAMGQLYVERFFPPEAKERMDKLVDNLLLAYEKKIEAADWMSDSTKEKALEKLHAVKRKIGYPDKWDHYEGVDIVSDNYMANLRSTRKFGYDKMIGKLHKPVDPDTWLMTPSTVNAYYNPNNNEIVFPAGILQPPFFNKDADDAVNYGAIGYGIGHEITHGFDDKGRLFDARGNMNDWWTKKDVERYEKQIAPAIEQANNYVVLDSVHLNGELTLGEYIADMGGISIAYNAFKMTPEGQSNEPIDGYTPDQRFFLSMAKVWLNKTTDEYLRQLVQVDPHPPAEFRVNGVLSNIPEFYRAFNVQPGDALYRPDSLQVMVW